MGRPGRRAPRIDGKPLADAVYPWLISNAALWYRSHRWGRDDRSAAPRAFGWVVVLASFALGWVFGIAVLAGLWIRSMPAHDEGLTLWIAACLIAATATGFTGIRAVIFRMRGSPRAKVARQRFYRWVLAGAVGVPLICVSWLKTEGGFENYEDWIRATGKWFGAPEAAADWVIASLPKTEIKEKYDRGWLDLGAADLAEAVLTRKPSGTVVYEHWVKDYVAKYREREDGNGKVTRQGETGEENTDLTGNRDFIKEAVARFNAPLDPPDLQQVDLRNARMWRVFLPGADLRRAQMQG
ncbi:MAG TPA: pentapeptide repeat-containing protein, partial [Thermohalobaculum sp.]|nr:pentapeptide repeat-containing protein [Thermohalobaculum sp.]